MSDFSLKSTPAHPARQHVDKLDGLQRGMLEALDADQVKKQLNDAKLRGVAQRVEYDDFEKLVKGAHLRPIKPRSTELDAIGKAFDGFVLPKVEAKAAGPALPPKPAAAQEPSVSVPSAPSSSNEFLRVWRRQLKAAEQRHTYIRQLDPAALPILFRTELDAGLFDSLVDALADPLLARAEKAVSPPEDEGSNSSSPGPKSAAEDGDVLDVSAEGAPAAAAATADDATLLADLAWAYAFLHQTSRLNRFDLTLDFADKKTISKLMRLFDAMAARQGAEALPSAADVLSLRAAFTSS